jgi:3-methyladenine DNA glycosylase AlkC
MASPLKELYSPAFYQEISTVFNAVVPNFDKPGFLQQIEVPEFEAMELKERMHHTTRVLQGFLPADYPLAISCIKEAIALFRQNGRSSDSLPFLFLPDYIEIYGLDDYEVSVDALEHVTQFISCEFAVRPFLIRYGERMISQMHLWSQHENHKVRRLASEGSRSRLPWAMAVPLLKKDPALVLPILEQLKNDPSEWVRRSVANSLNDIAKDHPQVVLNLASTWSGISKETDAIIKHGCRTLLKQGHPEILAHYKLDSKMLQVKNLEIVQPSVQIGESLEFNFLLSNTDNQAQKVRLEYAIFYRMQNGQPSKKVFKISEKIYPGNIEILVNRKQKFIPITTRKFYLGEHGLSIIVNGEEKAKAVFELY